MKITKEQLDKLIILSVCMADELPVNEKNEMIKTSFMLLMDDIKHDNGLIKPRIES